MSYREWKLKPETAAETMEVETPRGMRRRLREYARHNNLVHHVSELAYREGLSGEDEMTVLAYHALIQLEAMVEERLRIANLYPSVGIMPSQEVHPKGRS